MKRTIIGLLTIVLTLAIMTNRAHMQSTTAEAEAAARQVTDEFFVAFNAADNEALRKLSNYPHAFLLDNGRMAISETAGDLTTDFDRMRETEGWHHSTLDEYRVCQSSPEKVHIEIVFSRQNADGKAYLTVPALWIVTKQDGHWGLQFRSLMPAINE